MAFFDQFIVPGPAGDALRELFYSLTGPKKFGDKYIVSVIDGDLTVQARTRDGLQTIATLDNEGNLTVKSVTSTG